MELVVCVPSSISCRARGAAQRDGDFCVAEYGVARVAPLCFCKPMKDWKFLAVEGDITASRYVPHSGGCCEPDRVAVVCGTGSRSAQAALQARGGESAALARLQHYLWGSDAARTYFDTRNGMLGADFSTKFSPWLAAGCARSSP